MKSSNATPMIATRAPSRANPTAAPPRLTCDRIPSPARANASSGRARCLWRVEWCVGQLLVGDEREQRRRGEVIRERSPGEVQRQEWPDQGRAGEIARPAPQQHEESDQRRYRQERVHEAVRLREVPCGAVTHEADAVGDERGERSEERRVGKE